MKNEGSDLKVRVSDLAFWVDCQYQVVDDVRRPGVTPHKAAAGSQGVKPQTPLLKGPEYHRTPDGWDLVVRCQAGKWNSLSYVPRGSASTQFPGEMPSLPAPPLPGIECVGCDRYAPPILAPRGAWSRASPPSTGSPYGQCGIVSPECPRGLGVPKYISLGGRLFLPPCLPFNPEPP